MNTTARIYGQSMAFPPRVNEAGSIAWSQGPSNIRESIEIILRTELGERVYLPDFGGGLRRFLFEPNTVATRSLIAERITKSIEMWEPRVSLQSVDVEEDLSDPTAAIATVHYRLVATQTAERLALRIMIGG